MEEKENPDLSPDDSGNSADAGIRNENSSDDAENVIILTNRVESQSALPSIPTAELEGALERVITKRFSDKIERMVIEVIEKFVIKEIEKIKDLVLNELNEEKK